MFPISPRITVMGTGVYQGILVSIGYSGLTLPIAFVAFYDLKKKNCNRNPENATWIFLILESLLQF
jgi:hypothetical protein